MKVLSITTALLAILFLAGVVVNFAGADPKGRPGDANGRGNGDNDGCLNFVDEDGDGVNDNCPNEGERPQDGSGVQQGSRRGGRNNGKDGAPGNPDCLNFVDEDGDGVNDNCPNGGERPQDGSGVKQGSRRGGRRNNDTVEAQQAPSTLRSSVSPRGRRITMWGRMKRSR